METPQYQLQLDTAIVYYRDAQGRLLVQPLPQFLTLLQGIQVQTPGAQQES